MTLEEREKAIINQLQQVQGERAKGQGEMDRLLAIQNALEGQLALVRQMRQETAAGPTNRSERRRQKSMNGKNKGNGKDAVEGA